MPAPAKPRPLPAKLTRPQPTRALARTRLYQRLDQALEHPVTWLAGPPGMGKTTLASSYLEARKLKGIWYQVDAGDADPATLFHYMSIACRYAAPRYRTPLPAFTPEHRPGLAVFARRYFETLYARLKAPAVLVLDNYQEASADSAFHAIVAEAAAALPKGVRLLVLSRSQPPPAFARLRANDMLSVLDDTALKLTLGESCDIARLRGKAQLDHSTLERLHLAAAGWTAGLVLLLERSDSDARGLTATSHQVLFDYFATQIFFAFDATTQKVLCQTALLPQASAALAEQLTGESAAGQILADLYQRNYFVVKQGQGAVYQFHPLFHEFLLHRAQAAFPPDQLNALRRQAARLLEADGDIEAAAELWIAAADWNALAAHVLKHAPVVAGQARFQHLEGWLRALPPESLEHTPWLRYWLGACRMQFNPAEAQSHFEQAYAGFEHAGDAAGLYMAWASVAECIFMAWHDFTPLGRWLDALEALRLAHPQWPSAEIEHRVVGAAVAGYVVFRPDRPDLRRWLEQARRALEVMTDDVQRIQLATHAVVAFNILGQSSVAAALVESLALAAKAVRGRPLTQAFWDCYTILWHWRTRQESQAQFEQALASARTANLLPMVGAMLYGNASQVALMSGDLPLAEKLVQAASELLPPGSPFATAHYLYVSALVNLHSGRLPVAVEQARQAIRLLGSMYSFGSALNHITLFWALHESGDAQAARQHLDAARTIGAGMGSGLLEYWCALCEAHTAFEAGEAAQGQAALAHALGLSRTCGLFAYTWPRSRLAWLYAQALEHKIETEQVCELIRRLNLAPVDCATAPQGWPWSVKLHTLGRFAVTLDGKSLSFTGKVQKKPLELLMALASFGGREVSQARLHEMLWPDAQADAAHVAFTSTLYRLRKLLKDEEAVLLSGNHLRLNPGKVWVDAWAFERLVNRAETPGAGGLAHPGRLTHERTLAQYQGPFLDGNDSPWVLAVREKLRAKFLHFTTHASVRSCAAGCHEEALRWLDNGLNAEPLAEALYRERMRCQVALGQRAEALLTYRRCRKLLGSFLGIEPAAETQALYLALVENRLSLPPPTNPRSPSA